MTKDEIIQMAEDCGIAHQYYEIKVGKKTVAVESCTHRLLKFAKLVAEIEREACAKLCEQLGMATNGMNKRNYECAETIRARGENNG